MGDAYGGRMITLSRKKISVLTIRVILLVAGYLWSVHLYGSIQDALLLLIDWIQQQYISILLFVGIYVVRPYTLLPVAWVSIVAGTLWWRWPWLLLALGGEAISSFLAYLNGTYIGPWWLEKKAEKAFTQFHFFLLRYPFWAVLVSRLSPLPDDAINYGRWMLRIGPRAYIWWSLVGNSVFTTLNVAMGVQIDLTTLLQEWLASGINRMNLLRIGMIYGVVLLLVGARRRWKGSYLQEIYKHQRTK